MKASHFALLLVFAALMAWGYSCHVERTGVLKGEIAARGKSIEQLSQLAAKRTVVYQKAKAEYIRKPSLETCSLVLLTCEAMDSTNKAQITLLNEQVAGYRKLSNRGKLFGFLPKPHVQVGLCVGARLKPEPCVSGGFNIF